MHQPSCIGDRCTIPVVFRGHRRRWQGITLRYRRNRWGWHLGWKCMQSLHLQSEGGWKPLRVRLQAWVGGLHTDVTPRNTRLSL